MSTTGIQRYKRGTVADLTIYEVARQLAIHPRTARRLCRLGVIPGTYRCGGMWRVTQAGLDLFRGVKGDSER